MRDKIAQAIDGVGNLNELRDRLIPVLGNIQSENGGELIYVSGPISSDGEDLIERNRQLLDEQTVVVRRIRGKAVFSTVDIFTPRLIDALPEFRLPPQEREHHLRRFWLDLLTAGPVTELVMARRWEISTGARMEHDIAWRYNLQIEYLE